MSIGKSLDEIERDEELLKDRNDLNNYTNNLKMKNKRRFDMEIRETTLKNIDELHLQFHQTRDDLTHDQIVFLKEVFDFIKNNI